MRLESCHPSPKKSDVTLIVHALSKLPKEEKYTTRIYGYEDGREQHLVTACKTFWNSREKFMIIGNATSKEWQKEEKVKYKCTQYLVIR